MYNRLFNTFLHKEQPGSLSVGSVGTVIPVRKNTIFPPPDSNLAYSTPKATALPQRQGNPIFYKNNIE